MARWTRWPLRPTWVGISFPRLSGGLHVLALALRRLVDAPFLSGPGPESGFHGPHASRPRRERDRTTVDRSRHVVLPLLARRPHVHRAETRRLRARAAPVPVRCARRHAGGSRGA